MNEEVQTANTVFVGDVATVHLISGITVLGKLLGSDEYSIRLKKPMSLLVQPNGQQGQLAVSMMPYLSMGVFPALEELSIDYQHIVLTRPAPAQMEKLYVEMTSGIAIAPAGAHAGLIKPN